MSVCLKPPGFSVEVYTLYITGHKLRLPSLSPGRLRLQIDPFKDQLERLTWSCKRNSTKEFYHEQPDPVFSSPSHPESQCDHLFLNAGKVSVKRLKRTNTSSEQCNMLPPPPPYSKSDLSVCTSKSLQLSIAAEQLAGIHTWGSYCLTHKYYDYYCALIPQNAGGVACETPSSSYYYYCTQ